MANCNISKHSFVLKSIFIGELSIFTVEHGRSQTSNVSVGPELFIPSIIYLQLWIVVNSSKALPQHTGSSIIQNRWSFGRREG
jgi:hypothetical protein